MNRASLRNIVVPLWLGWTLLVFPGRAAEVEVAPRDVLVFKDGDRIQGQLLREEGGMLVFKSDRFGEQRVPVGAAVVIKAPKPVAPVVAAAATPAGTVVASAPIKKTEQAEAERVSVWERFSPAVLTAKVREYF